MKKKLLLINLLFLPFFVFAEEKNDASHEMHDVPDRTLTAGQPADYQSPPAPPPEGQEIRKYARDEKGNSRGNFGAMPLHDNMLFYTLRADRFEQRFQDGDDVLLWDVTSWIGGDYNKLYFESEGEYNSDAGKPESAEAELLYSRNISTFWDLQAGFRHDFLSGVDDRDFVAFGLQGLAPYWFEVDATSYLSDEGDFSAVIEAEYTLIFSQRLMLQSRFEMALALQDVSEYSIGSGINAIELGTRLRYEFSRKFAPYIGVEWEQNIGETKNMLQAAGEDTSKFVIVAGIKFWF